jgi:RecJ-like exonuclease
MTKPQDEPTQQDKPALNPGDVAEPGTPGTGEDVCPDCKGSGQIGSAPCPSCGGTGKVIEGSAAGRIPELRGPIDVRDCGSPTKIFRKNLL